MELRLLHSVQGLEGVVTLIEYFEREDSFIFVLEHPSNTKDNWKWEESWIIGALTMTLL